MSIDNLITKCRLSGITLWSEAEKLRYKAPKGGMSQSLLKELSEKKEDILNYLNSQKKYIDPNQNVIKPRQSEKNIPLSFAQERLWFLNQLEPENPSYNLLIGYSVKGNLNITAMKQSLYELIKRHEIFRTRFNTINGKSVQVISCNIQDLPYIVDLQGLSKAMKDEESVRIASEESLSPFDLEKDSLIRATLVIIEKFEYLFLIAMHHIVTDGWSIEIMKQELFNFYKYFDKGEPLSLRKLPIQYADYAIWQREYLPGEIYEKQLKYWKNKLDEIKPLSIQTDYDQQKTQNYHGESLQVNVEPEIVKKLKLISRDKETSLYMVILGVFSILLSRYSGQDDIAVGTSITNRSKKGTESLIGLFVNTLVMRSDLSGNPTFLEFIERVRKTSLDAYDNQDLPFEQLVHELQPERKLSRNPLLQVIFQFQNAQNESSDMLDMTIGDLSFRSMKLGSKTIRFDLEVDLFEIAGSIVGNIGYAKDLFKSETISRLIAHFINLLDEISANPNKRISEYSLLNKEEVNDLVHKRNKTNMDYPRERCVHELFEEQAEINPDKCAVKYKDNWLSYKELDTRSNQVARFLKYYGVGSESLVGIYMNRNPEMVIGLLGVLKAGGAYVPLDPSYPEERISYMLNDSKLNIVLTLETFTDKLPEEDKYQVVCLDREWFKIESEVPERLTTEVSPENFAYIIYTSGSTGSPKGVMISHHGLTCYTSWASSSYETDYGYGSPVHSSISFDLTVTSLYLPLLTGRTVVLVDSEETGEELLDVLKNEGGFSHVKITPAHLEILGRTMPPEMASGRTGSFIIGGEPFKGELLSFWQKNAPDTKLINEYGPTETVVGCCTYEVKVGEEIFDSVPIGRPIGNKRIYILDSSLQPVPEGVRGELYIGGYGIGRGYLNRPDLTMERFISDPFSAESGERMYRTGDLARYRSDGIIEFIGRIDEQVKIRGYRIELGEIESVLSHHPQVKECVVIVREDMPGDKHLVAYVVLFGDKDLDIKNIRKFLKTKLPDYMIPSACIILDSLPLTSNGKIDRKNLPSPDRNNFEGEYVAPRNEVEEKIAEIWKEILGINKVGIYDNFFEMGGDSILSIQVVSRLRDVGLVFTPREMFQNQSIFKLAQISNNKNPVKNDQEVVTGKGPLTPIQNWFFKQEQEEDNHYNQSAMFELEPNINPVLLEKSIKQLISHHDVLSSKFIKQDLECYQVFGVKNEGSSYVEMDLTHIISERQNETIQAISNDIQSSLNLYEGPLFRFVFFKLAENYPGRLLITVHHLIIDTISWRILIEDFFKFLNQLSNNNVSTLKTTSYKKWAELLSNYTQSEELMAELDYWFNKPWNDVSPIPVDYHMENKQNIEASTAVSVRYLNKENTDLLLHEVPKVYNTQINDILVTALGMSFSKLFGSNSLLFSMEGHGREDIFNNVDLSRTIGWFTSIYPVLINVDINDPIGESIKSVKEQLRTIPNKGIGYGILRYLAKEEITNMLEGLPQPQVSFNYHGQNMRKIKKSSFLEFEKLCGITVSPKNKRFHLIDINGNVIDDRLSVTMKYSQNFHCRESVDNLNNIFIECIESLIVHCTSDEAGGYTPADFSLASIDQETLDNIVQSYGE